MIKARPNWLDRLIEPIAPRLALKRALARGVIDETRGYDGAARGRHTQGWKASATSADSEILNSLPMLRNRQRDLERNNPHARKARSVWVNNLVGWGSEPRPSSGNPTLDAKAKQVWKEFVENADADGQLDFHGIYEIAVGAMVSGGESLIRRRIRRPEDGLPVPLQLQVMEGDHLDHMKNGPLLNNHVAVQGVEFDAIGQRSAYWLYPQHPGNSWSTAALSLQSRPVPASEVLHLYRKERTQTRGVPWGSAVIRSLRDLDDYEIAEIVRKKTEACVVAIVLGADEDNEGIAPSVTDARGNPVEQFEPGLIAYAHGGKEVRFNTPTATGGYAEYKRAGLHTVAAGYLVPYELMTGDLSQVNFSSSRVGLTEFRRLVTAVHWLCCVPIWRWVCEVAYLAGKLPVPYVPVTWPDLEFESVNPIDDANADLIRMRSGTMSWDDAVAKTGRNPDDVMMEIVARLKKFDEADLVFDSDARKVTKGGNEQPSLSKQAEEAARIHHLRTVK